MKHLLLSLQKLCFYVLEIITSQRDQFKLKVMKNSKTPKLTIVGAGPGDVELITIKAIKALENADVVLDDALVN